MSSLGTHPIFWFHDGSIVFRIEDCVFKVHKTLLSRHSPFFARQDHTFTGPYPDVEIDAHIVVDPSWRVRAQDVEVLLEHLYHDAPLHSETKFSRILAILRVSSPLQLNFPVIHALAKEKLNALFLSGDIPLYIPDDPHEAIATATEYQLQPMRKAMYYHFIISPDPSPDTGATQSFEKSTPLPPYLGTSTQTMAEPMDPKTIAQQRPLSPTDAKLCAQLMERLIDHFTPILFTPPATSHMACTDVFADTWMSLVIQPAIENDGVYKPLETLEHMKGIDWEKFGLCHTCLKDKKEEWSKEQQDVWKAMDDWLDLATNN